MGTQRYRHRITGTIITVTSQISGYVFYASDADPHGFMRQEEMSAYVLIRT